MSKSPIFRTDAGKSPVSIIEDHAIVELVTLLNSLHKKMDLYRLEIDALKEELYVRTKEIPF